MGGCVSRRFVPGIISFPRGLLVGIDNRRRDRARFRPASAARFAFLMSAPILLRLEFTKQSKPLNCRERTSSCRSFYWVYISAVVGWLAIRG
jgi:hypothetical protein